jgi:hypothetical protein
MPVPSRLFIASVVLCLAPLAACHDMGSSAAVAPAFTFSNGPGMPGRSPVIRVEGRNAFFIVDDARGIMSFHGQDVTLAEFCAGERDFDTMNRQFIEVPSGSVVALSRAPIITYGSIRRRRLIAPSCLGCLSSRLEKRISRARTTTC